MSELAAISAAGRLRLSRWMPGAIERRKRRARRQVIRALAHPNENPVVLFVCHGNICRSPFAEALLRASVGDGQIDIRSAGLMSLPARGTPELGLRASAAHRIDLSAHRSVWLTPELIETASLVIVFDESNRKLLFGRYPKLRTPVIGLGELLGLETIADPMGSDLAQFERVYGQIAEGVAKLASLIYHRQRS